MTSRRVERDQYVYSALRRDLERIADRFAITLANRIEPASSFPVRSAEFSPLESGGIDRVAE
jgi:hypothetical protein